MSAAVPLPKFTGDCVVRSASDDYAYAQYQYAISSWLPDTIQPGITPMPLTPAAIIFAANEQDIVMAMDYAYQTDVAIAVRSGGHSYNASSTTAGNNIQIDLSGKRQEGGFEAYAFHKYEYVKETNRATVGASVGLGYLGEKLKTDKVFLSFGECPTVHVGGHVQTGGYGAMASCVGMLCDRVRGFTIFTADADIDTENEVTKKGSVVQKRVISLDGAGFKNQREADIYWGICGGTPGNLGIVTEFVFEPLTNSFANDTRALMAPVVWSHDKVKECMQYVAELTDADTISEPDGLGAEVLFNFAVAGSNAHIQRDPLDENFEKEHPNDFFVDMTKEQIAQAKLWQTSILNVGRPVPIIILMFSYVNHITGLKMEDNPKAMAIYKKVKELMKPKGVVNFFKQKILDYASKKVMNVPDAQDKHGKPTPMLLSDMSYLWIFPLAREWMLPYYKHDHWGDHRDLSTNGFVDFVANQSKSIEQDTEGVYAFPQYSPMASMDRWNLFDKDGPNAKYEVDGMGRNSYNWRHTTGFGGVSIWYNNNPKSQAAARKFYAEDTEALAKWFTTTDRRLVCFPFSEPNIDLIWEKYWDTEAKYKRICGIKRAVDPHDMFTPNLFCVTASTSEKLKRNLAANNTDVKDRVYGEVNGAPIEFRQDSHMHCANGGELNAQRLCAAAKAAKASSKKRKITDVSAEEGEQATAATGKKRKASTVEA